MNRQQLKRQKPQQQLNRQHRIQQQPDLLIRVEITLQPTALLALIAMDNILMIAARRFIGSVQMEMHI
jgi:hypothetical protein